MGGGTMRVDPPLPQYRNTPNKLSSPSSSSSSSSPNPNIKPPLSTADNSMLLSPPYCSLSCCSCHSRACRNLNPVDGKNEAKTENSGLYDHVFEQLPSQGEVEDAISALQSLFSFLNHIAAWQKFCGFTNCSISECCASNNNLEHTFSNCSVSFIQAVPSSSTHQQISSCYDSRIFLSEGYKRLYGAIQLLQADPSIKRLVVSLSSDKAIWDAVMSNVMHPKLLESPDSVECRRPQISEQNEVGMYMLTWILDIIKGKVLELVESFQSFMNGVFQYPRMENDTVDATVMHEKLRSSLLLSIVILLIVIMARSERF